MVRDFGGREEPRWRKGQRYAYLRQRTGQGVLLFALVLMGLLPIAMPESLDEMNIVGRKPGSPIGKPCKPIDEARFNRGWGGRPSTFSFSGVTFARRRGDADCSAGKHGLFGVLGAIYPTCRFDVPYQLAVTSGVGTRYYDVPPGYTAVVKAAPDETVCTVTERFDLYDLANGL
jgi:hypothetical protein